MPVHSNYLNFFKFKHPSKKIEVIFFKVNVAIVSYISIYKILSNKLGR